LTLFWHLYENIGECESDVMMNKEQKFHKKHPLCAMIAAAVVAGIVVWMVTSSLNKPSLQVIEKEQFINNTFNNTYIIMNIGQKEVSGNLNIKVNKNDSFESIDVIKGNQYAKVQDKSGTIKFDLPKGEIVEVKTVSDNAVVSSVKLDETWYEKLKKRLTNLFESK
jgi:hypothetical protein